MKKYLLGVFKFYQPKATGGGFLIFEWTLVYYSTSHLSSSNFSLDFSSKKKKLHWYIPGNQEGLFKLAVQLRIFFNSVIYNTATGYVLLVYLTNI
jgi:hypothetical protein